jgi:hypothetical protein
MLIYLVTLTCFVTGETKSDPRMETFWLFSENLVPNLNGNKKVVYESFETI